MPKEIIIDTGNVFSLDIRKALNNPSEEVHYCVAIVTEICLLMYIFHLGSGRY